MELRLDERLVRKLIARQFPQFVDLSISRLDPGGWDNISFRLGETMLVKLPRDRVYAAQPHREFAVLDTLKDRLPLQIPRPIGLGLPSRGYPHHWVILEWIAGETVARSANKASGLPAALARFLRALHHPAPSNAPRSGAANLGRGGPLSALAEDFETALSALEGELDADRISQIWRRAIASSGDIKDFWVHGDIAPANLLQRDGKLCAVIDFGLATRGDPACDLAIAWLAFDHGERREFLDTYGVQDRTLLLRARVWALWKALLCLTGASQLPPGYLVPRSTIEAIIDDGAIG